MKIVCQSIAVAALLTLASQPALAQAPGSLLINWNLDGGDGAGSGTGNWTTTGNWLPQRVPDVNNEDAAVINGGGTAQVNAAVAQVAGGLVLGQGEGPTGGAAGDAGTLEVLSGSIVFDEDPTFPADGNVIVGNGPLETGGTGTLRMSGGSLTSVSLSSAGTAESLIELSGSASLATGQANLGRTTRVVGPDVDFAASGQLTLQESHTLVAEVTGPDHAPLATSATASVGGALQVDFNGHEPSIGDSWDLVSATGLTGQFSSLTVNGAPPLGLGQAFAVRQEQSGPNTVLRLGIDQRLVLTVDRDQDTVSIDNPGSSGIEIDGYSVRSAAASLTDGGWNSLAGQMGGGWVEANPSGNHLNEFNTSGFTNIGGDGSIPLGNIFSPPPPSEFGQAVEDLVFEYSTDQNPSVEGVVRYTGSSNINNLVLYADPASGEVAIRNTSPFEVPLDAYTVDSASGALQFGNGDWESLDDQNTAGGDWHEANVDADRVTEFKQDGATMLAPNTTFELGTLFEIGGDQDLAFEFALADEDEGRTGVVLYEPLPEIVGLPGDYNNNGVVDAADYTVWRDRLGQDFQLTNEVDGVTPGSVTSEDYAAWKARFGMTAGSGSGSLGGPAAVPEPATSLLLLLAAALCPAAAARSRLVRCGPATAGGG